MRFFYFLFFGGSGSVIHAGMSSEDCVCYSLMVVDVGGGGG